MRTQTTNRLEVPLEFPYTNSMKIKTFKIELREKIKVRQPWAPVTKKFKDKTKYNRRSNKLVFA